MSHRGNRAYDYTLQPELNLNSLQQYGYAYDAGAQSDTSSPYSTYAPLEPHHPVASTSSSPVHGYGVTRSPPRARQYIPRPLDWRPDFIAHAGATTSQKGRNITITHDPTPRDLLDILAHKLPHPPICHDLRFPPMHARCIQLSRPTQLGPLTPSDLMRSATQPPVAHMRLYHYRLPWYIDIVGAAGRAVTVHDVLTQLHTHLSVALRVEDVDNEELCDDDRDDIRRACWRRCGAMQPDKLRRVDFLCELTVFEGLMRNVEDGTWEMVLRSQ
ncbi:uncharacterized protein SCHCODRAFT_02721494 [Schizophyllum commune H4-8]|nr:uncharacterized protein SCHCODRAFT_02721494 [Schizophyllum commune H4-8]KAI5898108.1 hypothetical protein SCHCODRAFT_02721494 [Schizophyllum commune H4-8]